MAVACAWPIYEEVCDLVPVREPCSGEKWLGRVNIEQVIDLERAKELSIVEYYKTISAGL